MMKILNATLLVVVCAVLATGQSPLIPQGGCALTSTWAPLGGTATTTITGAPFAPFLLAIDLQPGSTYYPGFGRIWLGLTPNIVVPFDGLTGGLPVLLPPGQFTVAFPVPNVAVFSGTIAYMQAVALDPGSSTGFSLTNAVSVQFDHPDSYLPTLGTMMEPRSFHQTAPLNDGSFLIVGGGNGSLLLPNASQTAEIYNPYYRTFSPAANMANERTLHRATSLPDGRVLASGGSVTLGAGLNTAEIYDPSNDTWASTPNMNGVRIAHTATVLNDGRLLVCGGASNFVLNPPTSTNYMPIFTSALDTAEIYDPVTNTWAPTANNMSSARFGHAAITLPSGKILISGGCRGGQIVFGTGAPLYAQACDIFDPSTNSFTSAPGMALPRVVHTVHTLPNGNIMAIGGGGGIFLSSLGSTEIYDETTNSWSFGPALPGGQTIALHQGATLPDGSIYIGGGAIGAVGAFQGLNLAYRFDPATSTWLTLNTLPAARQSHSVNWSPVGVLLIGGADAGAPTAMPPVVPMAVDTAEVWTPDN